MNNVTDNLGLQIGKLYTFVKNCEVWETLNENTLNRRANRGDLVVLLALDQSSLLPDCVVAKLLTSKGSVVSMYIKSTYAQPWLMETPR